MHNSTSLKPLWPGFSYKEHQVTGVTWMMQRERAGTGGLLCDEMGLGKTIQMMGLIKNSVRRPCERSLLVAPVAVLEQWKAIVLRAGMSVMVPSESGYSWVPEGPVKSQLAPQVYIIGYERAQRSKSLVLTYPFQRVAFDEAHRLASGNGATELAAEIRTPHKWLLTGTPIVNKPRDLGNLLRLAGAHIEGKVITLDELRRHLKTFILARNMEQLRKMIPDAPPRPEYHKIVLPFSSEEEGDFYRGIQGIITRRWRALQHDGGAGAALAKLQLFMKLRQLSMHPQVYIEAQRKRLKGLYTRPDWAGSSTKFEAIQRLLRGADSSHKWIFFCHFHAEMELLRDMLEAETCVETVQLYHGGMTAEEKKDVLERTQLPVEEGMQEVLLVQLQSGGAGLNLQHFDRILFTGPWWTSAIMQQAVGRAVRIGQHKVVKVFQLRLAEEEEGTNIDAYMYEKAGEKELLCKEVLSGAEGAATLKEMAAGAGRGQEGQGQGQEGQRQKQQTEIVN
jgi:SNF2 family DNA or RNA helicase